MSSPRIMSPRAPTHHFDVTFPEYHLSYKFENWQATADAMPVHMYYKIFDVTSIYQSESITYYAHICLFKPYIERNVVFDKNKCDKSQILVLYFGGILLLYQSYHSVSPYT